MVDELKVKRAKISAEIMALKARLEERERDLLAIDRVLGIYEPRSDSASRTEQLNVVSIELPKKIMNRGVRLSEWIQALAKEISGDFSRDEMYDALVKNYAEYAADIKRDSVGAILAKLGKRNNSGVVKVSGSAGGTNLYHYSPPDEYGDKTLENNIIDEPNDSLL